MNIMWKIGNVDIKNRIVLAPMAGISNTSYRNIIKEM
jgi:tRNA-dihydrouridine synthase